MRTLFACCAFVALLVYAGSVFAQTDTWLPSSRVTPKGTWKTMHEGAFDGTVESATAACGIAAAVDHNDALTENSCIRLASMLVNNECKEVMVPNGVVFDFMSYRRGGTSYAQRGVRKELEDAEKHDALLCNLGSGAWAYYFNGERGCNNPAFVLLDPGKLVCTRVPFSQGPEPETTQHLPGYWSPSSCGCGGTYYPGHVIKRPDSSLRSQGYSERCVWVPQGEKR